MFPRIYWQDFTLKNCCCPYNILLYHRNMLTLQTTNLPLDRFPEYIDTLGADVAIMTVDGIVPNKLVTRVSDEPSRQPSPQPTHFSVPQKLNGNGHRVLRAATVGYIAPEFGGKSEQMEKGRLQYSWSLCCASNTF